MNFFKFLELKYDLLTSQINGYLRQVYNRSDETYDNASPFGQILGVLKNIFQFNILYQKNIVRNFQIEEADNTKAIRNLVRIAGHNPTRSITAKGTLKLRLKPSVDITSDIAGGLIRIPDKTQLKNKTNSLMYTIRFNKDEEVYRLSHTTNIYLDVVQGLYEEQQYTGNGEINQTYSVNIASTADVDNFDIEVLYNNTPLTIKDMTYDMLRNERACVVRTGMNGGIDIIFGNNNFGFIPPLGSIIIVRYLLTEGTNGQILTPQVNDFQYMGEIRDDDNNTVDMEKVFDTFIDKEIRFASNGESVSFMKAVVPNISRNFVLATPSQYIYNLRRLELFSKINVYNTLNDNNYENDNKIFLFLVPKISNFYSNTVNYFNVPLDAFYLDEEEINKTLTYLRKLGNIPINTVLEIIQPTITRYVLNVYVRRYEGYSQESIEQKIISEVSDYLTTLERDDRIVRSDIVSKIENIQGVDGVNIKFISKKNEDLHIIKPESKDILGLDRLLGDIVVEKNELALIRGGWVDRNNTYYNETIDSQGMGPINIIFTNDITQKT